jgi:hypothetical protein
MFRYLDFSFLTCLASTVHYLSSFSCKHQSSNFNFTFTFTFCILDLIIGLANTRLPCNFFFFQLSQLPYIRFFIFCFCVASWQPAMTCTPVTMKMNLGWFLSLVLLISVLSVLYLLFICNIFVFYFYCQFVV